MFENPSIKPTLAICILAFLLFSCQAQPTSPATPAATASIDPVARKTQYAVSAATFNANTSSFRTAAALTQAVNPTLPPTLTRTPFPPTPTKTPIPLADPSQTPILTSLRIVYVRDGNIYMKDRGRPEVQLTFTGMDADPVISPDGEWIAFRRWVNIPPKDDPYGDHPIESELRIMDKNGAFKKTLMSIEELDSLLPMDEHPIYGGIHPHRIEFIRDSDLIMFSTFAWGMRYSSHYDLHVVDSKTSEWQTLFGMWGAVSVTLSPNGKHIAVANSGIHIVGIANLTIRQDIIVNGFYHSGAPWINNVRPQWSHDSSFFVVAVESDLNSEDQYVYGNQIWQVFVDERPPILLSTITTIYEAGSIRWLLNAKISLDLGRMYYACPDPVSPPPAALLCFSALNGENLIVYPFPHDRNPIYPFEQEDFPTQSVLGPTDYKDKWVDARHRIGYWGEGIALIQSGPPAKVVYLVDFVNKYSSFSFALLD